MLSLLRGLLFGCPHRNLSRVFTDPITKASRIVCLTCGWEIPYNLTLMRVEPHLNQETVAECQR